MAVSSTFLMVNMVVPEGGAAAAATLLVNCGGLMRPISAHCIAEPGMALPPIKISWLKKFDGDDFLHPEVLNRTSLPFTWCVKAEYTGSVYWHLC